MRSSWMLARLERETRDHHAAAEADLFRVLDEPTLAGYRRFLATIYHFEYAVEAKLVRVAELPIRFVAARLRSGLLGDDLFALSGHPDVFARPVEVPSFAGAADALGWLYVLQRNTLQHAALYRALAPRLRSTLHQGDRYLNAFANDVHARWYELGGELDRVASSPERAQRIVDVARDAFVRQHAWYLAAAAPSSAQVAFSA